PRAGRWGRPRPACAGSTPPGPAPGPGGRGGPREGCGSRGGSCAPQGIIVPWGPSMTSRLSSFLLATVGAAVVLGPAIALLPGLTDPTEAPPFYPHGDHAVLELYTRLAASGDQRLGPYSRFHFHHPGPALFYLSMPVYELAGESHEGLKLAALLINALSVAGLLGAARRLGGLAAYFATALVLAAFVPWLGPAGLCPNR